MQNHKPSKTALLDVIKAFKNAPVTYSNGHVEGIYLHVLLSDEVPHKTSISGPNNGADTSQFTLIKNIYFGNATERNNVITNPSGTAAAHYCNNPNPSQTIADQCVKNVLTAQRQVFHYALFGHDQASAPTSSGISEVISSGPAWGATNDMFISLGEWAFHVGNVDQQEGTFMHELGHNLGLGHGGPYKAASDAGFLADASVNFKPNYLSVMSWSRQISDPFFSVGGRPLTYSSEGEGPPHPNTSFRIDESATSIPETAVTAIQNQYTLFGNGGLLTLTRAGPPGHPDWDTDLSNEDTADDVAQDLNTPSVIVHSGYVINGTSGSTNPSITVTSIDNTKRLLHTWDDWDNLMFDMTPTSSFSDGAGGSNNRGNNGEDNQ